MDVTAGFTTPKPAIAAGDSCGVPLTLPGDAQWLATFDPFVEARLAGGRSSSCIDCHARARTPPTGKAANYVPKPGATDDYPGLKDFEGHVRTDYDWSLAHFFDSLSSAK